MGQPAFAPDSSQYAVAEEGRIRLWDGRTGEYQASLPLPSRVGTYSITYRPDSPALVIASTDGRTWTADTRIDRGTTARVRRRPEPLGRGVGAYFPNAPYECDVSAVAGRGPDA